jgi:Cellulose synthase subunit D
MALFSNQRPVAPSATSELDYLLRERVSIQWAGFLQAFSAEMQTQLAPEEYRTLLKSMGKRLAAATELSPSETVQEFESVINAYLVSVRWGYVRLDDSGAMLTIHHYFDPLSTALGEQATVSSGFLEGLFEQWFHAAGAESALGVAHAPDHATAVVNVYLFGRHHG